MREVTVCPICNSTKFSSTLTCTDYTVSNETFSITRCTQCLFRVTSPAPENEILGRYYQSVNYISHSSKATSLIDKIYLLARTYTLNWKIKILSQALANPINTNVLDFGCGTGEFLQKCKSKGWQIQGVEPSTEARKKAEINCHQNIAASLSEVTKTDFNFITLWHVLEHIPELNPTLSLIQNKLNQNGRLIVALPNPNSFDAQHYKKYWAAFDVPRHLWHFDQRSAENLLMNHGFTLVSKIPMPLDAFYVCLLSEKYLRNGKTTFAGIAKALFIALRSNLKARKTGDYSSIIYIAKK